MATWQFYGFTSGTDTGFGASSAVAIATSKALSFGGTDRSTFQGNINLDTWNNSMHLASSSAESSTDHCGDSHLWPLHPVSTFIPGSWVDSGQCLGLTATVSAMTASTPEASRGLRLHFSHTASVRCNPVSIWAGQGTGASTALANCIVAIVELATSYTSALEWTTVQPTSKLSLSPHTVTSTGHSWYVGIAVRPTVVGFNDDNRMKIETTYY